MQGKIVVITGATGGIGKACAFLTAKMGGIPVLLARSEQSLFELQEEISKLCPASTAYLLDVTQEEMVKITTDKILSHYGKIDAWINNAGYGIFAPLTDANLQDYKGMMETNYFGTVYGTKSVLPVLLNQNHGVIINVASVAGLVGTPKSGGYSASKAAVIQFTRCIRQELQGTQIRILSINPGPVHTPFFERTAVSRQYKKKVESFMISPDQVAKVILQAVEKGKKDIVIPSYMDLGAKLNSLFPTFYEKVIAPLADKK